MCHKTTVKKAQRREKETPSCEEVMLSLLRDCEVLRATWRWRAGTRISPGSWGPAPPALAVLCCCSKLQGVLRAVDSDLGPSLRVRWAGAIPLPYPPILCRASASGCLPPTAQGAGVFHVWKNIYTWKLGVLSSDLMSTLQGLKVTKKLNFSSPSARMGGSLRAFSEIPTVRLCRPWQRWDAGVQKGQVSLGPAAVGERGGTF